MYTIQNSNHQGFTTSPFQMIHPNQMIQPQMNPYQIYQQMNPYQQIMGFQNQINMNPIQDPYFQNMIHSTQMNQSITKQQNIPMTSEDVERMIAKPRIPSKWSSDADDIIQNMNGKQAMMDTMNTPPYMNNNPYNSNIVGFGIYGYNNNYIPNNQFNNYYNPYLEQSRMQYNQIAFRDNWEQQAKIYKAISRVVNRDMSDEEFAIHSKQYDLPTIEDMQHFREEQEKYNDFLKGFYLNSLPPSVNQHIININTEIMRVKSLFPDDMCLGEWLERSGEVKQDALMKKMEMSKYDLSTRYNSSKYRELVDKYTKPGYSYFESLFVKRNPDGTDTLEIRLPDDIRTEYEERKKGFMATLE